MKHVHAALPSRREKRPFTGPVRSPPNVKAHDGICQVDFCECGAKRMSNRNAGAIEMGRWMDWLGSHR